MFLSLPFPFLRVNKENATKMHTFFQNKPKVTFCIFLSFSEAQECKNSKLKAAVFPSSSKISILHV